MEPLNYTQDDVNKVRKHYHMQEKYIARDIGILRNWIRQQRHLPQNQDDDFLEKLLMRNKFRMEKAKCKLDGYYTLKGMYRKEFYEECNKSFVPSKEVVLLMPFPKLTTHQERIYLMKFQNTNPELYDIRRVVKFGILLLELSMRNDYAIGEKIIVDCQGATLDHMKRISIPDLVKAENIYTGAYSGRPRSIEIINAPTFLQLILTVLKAAIPQKLYSRINIHNDLESLHKVCPKQCLSSDYGGDLPSINELQNKWDEVFEQNQKMFDDSFHYIANEKLRIGTCKGGIKNNTFGVEGTFKTLNLD